MSLNCRGLGAYQKVFRLWGTQIEKARTTRSICTWASFIIALTFDFTKFWSLGTRFDNLGRFVMKLSDYTILIVLCVWYEEVWSCLRSKSYLVLRSMPVKCRVHCMIRCIGLMWHKDSFVKVLHLHQFSFSQILMFTAKWITRTTAMFTLESSNFSHILWN